MWWPSFVADSANEWRLCKELTWMDYFKAKEGCPWLRSHLLLEMNIKAELIVTEISTSNILKVLWFLKYTKITQIMNITSHLLHRMSKKFLQSIRKQTKPPTMMREKIYNGSNYNNINQFHYFQFVSVTVYRQEWGKFMLNKSR